MSLPARKYALELIDQLCSSLAMFGEEDFDYDDEPLEELGLEALIEFHAVMDTVGRAHKLLAEHVDSRIMGELREAGETGTDRAGTRYFITTATGSVYCKDPTEFSHWLAQGDVAYGQELRRVFNFNYVRKGGVTGVADDRGEDGEAQYRRWFARKQGDEKLKAVREEYLP